MKTSYVCVILLSALVVQISSETTELDQTINKIISSSFEIVAKPIQDLINEIQVKSDIDQFLKEFASKVRWMSEQGAENFFDMFPPKERENQKKIIGYTSMYMSGAYTKALRAVSSVTNKSFDALPDNVKTQLLDIGNDINDFLRRIGGRNIIDPKTSQKTNE